MPPRRRPKTRTDQLVDALTALDRASACLEEIDLRTTSGDLRKLIKESRATSKTLKGSVTAAIQADKPINPLRASPAA